MASNYILRTDLAGTVKNTTGTTVGTDMKNTGQVVMAQTFAADLSGGATCCISNRCNHSCKLTNH